MKTDPLDTALREIAETKNLLECLITSSESFDYPKAKIALKQLNRKVQQLGKLRAQFEGLQKARHPNIHVLDFNAPPPTNVRPLD